MNIENEIRDNDIGVVHGVRLDLIGGLSFTSLSAGVAVAVKEAIDTISVRSATYQTMLENYLAENQIDLADLDHGNMRELYARSTEIASEVLREPGLSSLDSLAPAFFLMAGTFGVARTIYNIRYRND